MTLRDFFLSDLVKGGATWVVNGRIYPYYTKIFDGHPEYYRMTVAHWRISKDGALVIAEVIL